jgi:hypothetical protein
MAASEQWPGISYQPAAAPAAAKLAWRSGAGQQRWRYQTIMA